MFMSVSEKIESITAPAKIIQYNYWGSGGNEPPAHLLTKNQLREKRLKLAPGQEPAGGIWIYKRDGYLYLYDENQAIPIPPPSEKQKAGLEKARQTKRTCTTCGQLWYCEILLNRRDKTRICDDCKEKKRRQPLVEQAQSLLADPNIVILDTETTGLEGPQIIQIAVIDGQGATLLNSLVRLAPGATIEPDATAIHGITEADLEAAPAWSRVWPELKKICHGKTVLAYNSAFDWRAIANTCKVAGIDNPTLGRDFFCLMEFYAEYYGDYSDYYGRYQWQALPFGDHSALGDSLAALRLLKSLAAGKSDQVAAYESMS